MIHSSLVHSAGSLKEQEYLAGWQRSRAELETYRRRVHDQMQQQRELLKREAVMPLLAVADNFAALTQHVPKGLEKDAWVQGVLHVARSIEQILSDMGLIPVGKVKEQFDPHVHEAIEEVEGAGVQSGVVVEVVQSGYKIGEHLVRPARVKIAK